MVPARGNLESVDPRGSSQRRESTSPKGSVSDLNDGLGNLDRSTLCSHETNFESNLRVYNLSLELSRDVLEKSAWAHSMLQVPSFGDTSSDKGTMRQMALSMAE